jgi:hypothetical protein
VIAAGGGAEVSPAGEVTVVAVAPVVFVAPAVSGDGLSARLQAARRSSETAISR